jgi:hypothetical protein
VFNVQGGAEHVELVRACGRALSQAEEPIRKLLAVIHCPLMVCLQTMRGGQNGASTDRAGALQIAQKPPRVGRARKGLQLAKISACACDEEEGAGY